MRFECTVENGDGDRQKIVVLLDQDEIAAIHELGQLVGANDPESVEGMGRGYALRHALAEAPAGFRAIPDTIREIKD